MLEDAKSEEKSSYVQRNLRKINAQIVREKSKDKSIGINEENNYMINKNRVQENFKNNFNSRDRNLYQSIQSYQNNSG